MTVKLGAYVKDKVTEFAGIVTGRCEYLHEETRVRVSATPLSQGGIKEEWLSEERVEEYPAP